jgi:hypothetical protein
MASMKSVKRTPARRINGSDGNLRKKISVAESSFQEIPGGYAIDQCTNSVTHLPQIHTQFGIAPNSLGNYDIIVRPVIHPDR